jgi:DNA-binding XRE family transcriptional regulator
MDSRKELVERRKKLNLTQDQVAEEANISRAYYVNIEAGRKDPSIKVAKRIADVMETTVDRLFCTSGVPEGNEIQVSSA